MTAHNPLTRRLDRACKPHVAIVARRYAFDLAVVWNGLSIRQLAQDWPTDHLDPLAARLIALAGSEDRAGAAIVAAQREARRKVIEGTADPTDRVIGLPPNALQRLYEAMPDDAADLGWADLVQAAQRYGVDPDEVPL